jgi:chaperone modulatory protein CbpM
MKEMHNGIVVTGLIVDENILFTLTEVRQRFSIDDAIMDAMLEHGLIEPKKNPAAAEMCVDQQTLQRIQTALHLYHDLGVNIAGVALVLDVLNELATVRSELHILQRHLTTHR